MDGYFRSLVAGAETKIPLANGKYVTAINFDNAATTPPFCSVMKEIAQDVEFGFWEKYDETHSVIRFATSWATTMEDTQKLIQILEKNK